ncbi:trypco2 family protein [Streptomyces lavendulocolor]|uniref:trypco2 family protein n=1 Tax=Streptomyces lavendulocolor TaxID=67316 RepID=UPI0031D33E98
MAGSNNHEWLDLAEAVSLLRTQLAQAQQQVVDEGDNGVQFLVGEITLELGLELTGTRSAGAGLRFSVVSADGKADRAKKATHKVTVQLTPQTPAGVPIPINDFEPE